MTCEELLDTTGVVGGGGGTLLQHSSVPHDSFYPFAMAVNDEQTKYILIYPKTIYTHKQSNWKTKLIRLENALTLYPVKPN